MPVITKYVVERNGVEKMTFSSKAEADAYDKLLDMSDELYQLLEESKLIDNVELLDKLSMHLAQNKDNLLVALGTKRKPAAKKSNKEEIKQKTNQYEEVKTLKDIVIETDEEAMIDTEDMIDMSNDLDEEIIELNDSDEAA
ncbi:YebG family protein [Marinomonas phaeophyticola]|uniref:YebG family protein n=1 Tax=Marinomonas phaeophyticola TaxID=3004091 RepID=UPI003204BB28